MTTWKCLATSLALGCATAMAQGLPAPELAQVDQAPVLAPASGDTAVKSARSRVSAVTVYQGNALVTRDVDVPAGKGLIEIVVTPLPPQTVDSSLYAEGTDGVRVLSTRYRTRAAKADTRQEVRAKEEQIHTLKQEAEGLQKQVQVIEQNLQLLTKLENFTGATLQQLAEKGLLNSEASLTLARYVMESRAEKSAAQVALQQKLQANAEATQFATRELGELTSGSSRTERDAVIVVDRAEPAGRVRLSYLVTAATWRPQYRFRAGTAPAGSSAELRRVLRTRARLPRPPRRAEGDDQGSRHAAEPGLLWCGARLLGVRARAVRRQGRCEPHGVQRRRHVHAA